MIHMKINFGFRVPAGQNLEIRACGKKNALYLSVRYGATTHHATHPASNTARHADKPFTSQGSFAPERAKEIRFSLSPDENTFKQLHETESYFIIFILHVAELL